MYPSLSNWFKEGRFSNARKGGDRCARPRKLSLEPLEQRTLLSVMLGGNMVEGTSGVLPREHLFDYGGYLTDPSTDALFDIARDFLTDSAADLGLAASDLQSFVVTDQYSTGHNAMTHVYLQQTYNGLPIVDARINVNLTADGRVINAGSTFMAGLGMPADGLLPTPAITAPQALEAFAADLGGTLNALPVIVSPAVGHAQETLLCASGVSLEDVPAELQYVATADGLELAWRLNVQTVDRAHWFDASVNALDGELLHLVDWTDNASYNVFAQPVESPSHGDRSIEGDPDDATASPYGWHDTDGIAGAEYTITRGNNVHAYAGFYAEPNGGPELVFDDPLDLTQEPDAYREAAVTNLFYWNNLLHDVHYQYGFDEVAGNFQQNNYGKGGVGSDYVMAEAQDGSDVNNAMFYAPPDGENPVMLMYLWTYSTPRRDSDLDSGIIVHEYGHGVSNRLTGGPANAGALDEDESRSMGEGWSDWYALMFTQEVRDKANDARGLVTYLMNEPPDGDGFRTKPYSYDMAINTYTYMDTGGLRVPHGVGEVWAATLWDLNWALIEGSALDANLPDEGYGFDPDLYHGNGGNNLALQLVMDAMKLQPANPTFLDGRDAILLADLNANYGANQDLIWTVFARRGMGYSADDGGTPEFPPVAEAFDLPPVTLTVTHPVTMTFDGSDDVAVTVLGDGSPREGARVVVYNPDAPSEAWIDTTDINGQVTFVDLSPQQPGTYYEIVITDDDAMPYEGAIFSENLGGGVIPIHAGLMGTNGRDDGTDEKFVVVRDGANLDLEIWNNEIKVHTRSVTWDGLQQVHVIGSSDDDTLIVDLSDEATVADTIPPLGIVFRGFAEEDDGDQLQVTSDVIGGTTIDTAVYNVTTWDAGQLDLDASTITFAHLESAADAADAAVAVVPTSLDTMEVNASNHVEAYDLGESPVGGTPWLLGEEGWPASVTFTIPNGLFQLNFGPIGGNTMCASPVFDRRMEIYGGVGGDDTVHFFGTDQDDTFTADSTEATLISGTTTMVAFDVTTVIAHAQPDGTDTATLHGSDGDDVFRGYHAGFAGYEHATLTAAGAVFGAEGFPTVIAETTGGIGTAHLYGTYEPGAGPYTQDDLVLEGFSAAIGPSDQSWSNEAIGFDTVYCHSLESEDPLPMTDTLGFNLEVLPADRSSPIESFFWDEQGDGTWKIGASTSDRWLDWHGERLGSFPTNSSAYAVVETDTVTDPDPEALFGLSVLDGGTVNFVDLTLDRLELDDDATVNIEGNGDFELQSGGQYLTGMGGTIVGLIDVGGNATLGSNTTLSLLGATPLTINGSLTWGDFRLTIISADGSGGISGEFGSVPDSYGTQYPASDSPNQDPVVPPDDVPLPKQGQYLGAGMWFGTLGDGEWVENPPDSWNWTVVDDGVYYFSDPEDPDEVQIGVFQAAAGDIDGNAEVDISDIMAIQAAGKFGENEYASWTQGDFDGDHDCDISDIMLILATGLFDTGRYWPDQGERAGGDGEPEDEVLIEATAELLVTDKGLVIDTHGLAINGYFLESKAGVFTGEPADNLGQFTQDKDTWIVGAVDFALSGTHLLGKVIGKEFTAWDLGSELRFSYAIEGHPGIHTGTASSEAWNWLAALAAEEADDESTTSNPAADAIDQLLATLGA